MPSVTLNNFTPVPRRLRGPELERNTPYLAFTRDSRLPCYLMWISKDELVSLDLESGCFNAGWNLINSTYFEYEPLGDRTVTISG